MGSEAHKLGKYIKYQSVPTQKKRKYSYTTLQYLLSTMYIVRRNSIFPFDKILKQFFLCLEWQTNTWNIVKSFLPSITPAEMEKDIRPPGPSLIRRNAERRYFMLPTC